ncbi:hypothetical protein LGM58_20100 [Burkholderia contaminans]|uniref:hypothetical protein n=1 Tax=Burkholderia contaminans TaxID=488447 RepID=UPI001CF0EA5E|nr:hypothetical protein [Burkholderia contaminans]MCA7885488.1 hypothetical protein [Burkholderia contaminans]
MSTRRATAIAGLSGYVARKDHFKRERAQARASLRRIALAFRVSVSASAASFCVTLGALLSLATSSPAGCRVGNLTVFSVVETLLTVVSVTTSIVLYRQSVRTSERLAAASSRLSRARARLIEMRETMSSSGGVV